MAQNNTADLKTYSKAWYDKMVTIWRDRIDAMDILDTDALRGSVTGKGFSMDEMGGQMAFQFLQYGIYVDLGTGKGYKRGNGGDLEFLFLCAGDFYCALDALNLLLGLLAVYFQDDFFNLCCVHRHKKSLLSALCCK